MQNRNENTCEGRLEYQFTSFGTVYDSLLEYVLHAPSGTDIGINGAYRNPQTTSPGSDAVPQDDPSTADGNPEHHT